MGVCVLGGGWRGGSCLRERKKERKRGRRYGDGLDGGI